MDGMRRWRWKADDFYIPKPGYKENAGSRRLNDAPSTLQT
jgi:hypothetical protein